MPEPPKGMTEGGAQPKETPGGFSKFAPTKPKDGSPKDASKVKLKAPDMGPGISKPSVDAFGSDADDIEIIEDDLKTG
jgi:hypothetical protein